MTIPIRSDLIKRLVRQAVNAELRRLAAEEAAQWSYCFGEHAPKDPATQVDRIIRVASTRAISADMRANLGAEDSVLAAVV